MSLEKTKKTALLSIIALYLICAAMPARAVDIATHSSAGCNFPDTNQSVSYTATFGEDHDYSSTVSTMSFTIYNPVGISSVTVDNRTGLMWVTTPSTDAGFTGEQTWESALTSCTVTMNGGSGYANYKDWRLPNVRELMSIVDYGAAVAPRIDTTAFPGTVAGGYWTSTTYVPGTTRAWTVFFNVGNMNYNLKSNTLYVRCVRGGP